MRKLVFTLFLITAASTAAANSKDAAQLCAVEASKLTGDKNFVLEKLRQPLLLHPKYDITLQSASNQNIQCTATQKRLLSLTVDGESKIAAK